MKTISKVSPKVNQEKLITTHESSEGELEQDMRSMKTVSTENDVSLHVTLDISNQDSKEEEKEKNTSTKISLWFNERSETILYDGDRTVLSLILQTLSNNEIDLTKQKSYGLIVRNHLDQILSPTTKLSEALVNVDAVEIMRNQGSKKHPSMGIKVVMAGWLERKVAQKNRKWKKYYFIIKKGSNMLEYYEDEPDHVDCMPTYSYCLPETKVEVISCGFSFIVKPKVIPSPKNKEKKLKGKSMLSTLTRGMITLPEDELEFSLRTGDEKEQKKWTRAIFTGMRAQTIKKQQDREKKMRMDIISNTPRSKQRGLKKIDKDS